MNEKVDLRLSKEFAGIAVTHFIGRGVVSDLGNRDLIVVRFF
jgi:hypothetical protein